ncbi:translation elongation factor LepA [Cutibacterium acnes JCM 18918]|nr:translation elongation factor LepA [Cutibacterium acnes JCM 18918]
MPAQGLSVGEVGYLITGVKDVRQSRVGDTVTNASKPSEKDLGGYQHPKPMVYSGLFPIDAKDFPDLRDALDKLQLNDAALVYEPETSTALGFGFRVGFLGLLHMEIVRERLEREFDLDLISTAPSVVHHVLMEDGSTVAVTNPSEYPTSGRIAEVREPIVDATILSPAEYIGTILELCQQRRGVQQGLDYLSSDRVEIRYRLPLSEIVFDFFDQLKSRTKGYASLDYHEAGEQAADLVKVDILLNGDPVDALSSIVHRDKSYSYGVAMAAKLKELIPRQQFEVPVQAAIGARVIARETIRAVRKDVLAKCYGGDISRKRKLLEKQKAGKKRMKVVGSVEVPQEAFVAALRTGESTEKKVKGLKAYRLDVPPMLADRGIDRMLAFAVPLTVRFRGIKVREGTLLHGPEGWGEWSPFWDYDPVESASWLRAGIEGATRRLPVVRRDRVPINVTIPVVDADRAGRMAAESACLTAKVKVADPRSDLREDCRRVAAVREAMPDGHIRVDANTAWDVDAAVRAITELDAAAEGLEYVEQPCASVAELAQVRRKVNVPVAADESVRRAEDPLAVARAGAADLLIVKAQPLVELPEPLRSSMLPGYQPSSPRPWTPVSGSGWLLI